MQQRVCVRINNELAGPENIRRGVKVRQACCLSLVLFNIYAEAPVKESFENIEERVKVGGKLAKSVRFADDSFCFQYWKQIICYG